MNDILKAREKAKLDFGEVEKCAIFVHYSINDSNRIEEKKNRLIKYCEEIGSFLEERAVFNSMLKRFESGEFSHLVVTDVGQIYKLSYDMQKAIDLTDQIQDLNVTTICVDEERHIKAKNKLRDVER